MVLRLASLFRRMHFPTTTDVLVVRSRHDLALSSISAGLPSLEVDPAVFPIFLSFRYLINFVIYRNSSRVVRYLVAIARSCRCRVVLATDSIQELTEVARLMPQIEVVAVMHGFYIDQGDHKLRECWSSEQRSRVSLFAFGQYDIHHYKRWGNLHDNVFPVGSTNNCLYLTEISQCHTHSYDLCIVQGSLNPHADDYFSLLRLANWQRIVDLVNQLNKLVEMKIVVALNSSSKQSSIEEWFRRRIPGATFVKSSVDQFSTYRAIDNSVISIGEASTALIEGLARGNRCLAVNSTGLDILSFPVPALVSLVNPTFDDFRHKVYELQTFSDANFRKAIYDELNFVINANEQHLSIKKVRDHITLFCRRGLT